MPSLGDDSSDPPRRRVPRWLWWIVGTLVAALVLSIVFDLVSGIDWSEVGNAIGQISLVGGVLLFALVVLRQTLNAVPLAMFVEGLGVLRSTINDLAANLVATTAPPPGDMVVRFGMFRTWRIKAEPALAGYTLNTVIFYVLRFAAPLVGFTMLLLAVRFDASYGLIAVVSGVIAALIAGAIVLVVRAEASAAWLGRFAGNLARRIKPDAVDPQTWADKMVHFRGEVQDVLRKGWVGSAVAMTVMLLVEGVTLVVALDQMGITGEVLDPVEVIAAYLVLYPLTALPFSGFGVIDVLLIQIFTSLGGANLESGILAGLIVWRAFTLILPLLLGLLSLLWWKRTSGVSGDLKDLAKQEADLIESNDAPAEPQG